MFDENKRIISVILNTNGVEIVFRQLSHAMYPCSPPRPVPDKVWKEIWRISDDGELYLHETKNGTHTPAHKVNEKIEFNEKTN